MCLGELAQVVRVDAPARSAEVVAAARRTTVSLLVLDQPVAAGDWLLVHAGFALERLSVAEAADAARLRAATGPEEAP